MIIRNRKINANAAEIQLSASFSKVDVLKWLRYYSYLACHCSSDVERFWLSNPQTEKDIRYWLEHDCMVFGIFEERLRRQLSAWAWNVAVREKYFEQSSTPGKDNEYYPTDILLKRVGRPKKEEEYGY